MSTHRKYLSQNPGRTSPSGDPGPVTPPPDAVPSATDSPLTHEQIANRAYEIYSGSGKLKGHCVSNWQQAERELRGRKSPSVPSDSVPVTNHASSGSDQSHTELGNSPGFRNVLGVNPPTHLTPNPSPVPTVTVYVRDAGNIPDRIQRQ